MEIQEEQSYLSIDEMMALHDVISTFDDNVSDKVLDAAEFFDIEEDEESLESTVNLYDKDNNVLVTFIIDDYEMGLMYLTELFDIDDSEIDSFDSE
jgi:hypothetical protein